MFLLSTKLYSQNTIIVTDSTDRRFIAYKDSIDCYKFGMFQALCASQIKDQSDTAIGHKYLMQIEDMRKSLHLGSRYKLYDFDKIIIKRKHIKPIGFGLERIKYKDTEAAEYFWAPAIYKKPFLTVLYQPIKK